MKWGTVLFSLLLLLCFFGPHFFGHDINQFNLRERLQGPSHAYILGTDENGSDLFTLLCYGGRTSFKISMFVVTLASLIGIALGIAAAIFPNIFDETLTGFIDIMQAFPGFLLALTIMAFLGSSTINLIFALTITSWIPMARLVRAETKSLKQKDFVEAARALGAKPSRILRLHLLPHLFTTIVIQISFSFAAIILSEAGLSFLGLGPSNANGMATSWGAVLNSGRRHLTRAPHICIFSGAAIFLAVLSLNLIANDLNSKRSGP